MSSSILIRAASVTLLLASAAACDRASRAPAGKPAANPAAATASPVEAGATTAPLPDSTVALSGAVRDLPPATTPDSTLGKPVAKSPAAAAVRPPPPVDTVPRTAPPGETAAMREFREAQERRDRELLERDMNAPRDGVARNDRDPRNDPRDEDARYDDAALDEARHDDTDDPALDDPMLDDRGLDDPALDDPSLDEDLPPDDEDLPPGEEDLPPEEDGDLRWDPATGTWR